jgi:RNA polymerase sigma-70 factor (sigma-E family)
MQPAAARRVSTRHDDQNAGSMSAWAAPPSFDEFVNRRHTALLRFAHVLCGDADTAADLVQDALVRTGLAWARVLRQQTPEAYVRRTIVNLNLNRWRRFRRERLVDAVPDRASPEPESESRDDAVWTALARLPKSQRTVIVLRFYEDMTQAEIADLLGCSIGTVKSNGARGMDKLRDLLADRKRSDRKQSDWAETDRADGVVQ